MVDVISALLPVLSEVILHSFSLYMFIYLLHQLLGSIFLFISHIFIEFLPLFWKFCSFVLLSNFFLHKDENALTCYVSLRHCRQIRLQWMYPQYIIWSLLKTTCCSRTFIINTYCLDDTPNFRTLDGRLSHYLFTLISSLLLVHGLKL